VVPGEDDGDRASLVGDTEAPPNLTEDERALLESRNAIKQFDRLVELIREATAPGGRFRLRPSTLQELNRYAIEGMRAAAGAFRTSAILAITGSQHAPPEWTEVPRHVDDMCDYVNDNWTASPIHLASYVMWRLNWIHPFPDGNGRTSRAVSYLVMCARLGYLIPGHTTIPQRIAAAKRPYYRALEQADEASKEDAVDVSAMEALLEEFLEAQLREVHRSATGKPIRTPVPPGPAWGGGD
jgi:Fic family protein